LGSRSFVDAASEQAYFNAAILGAPFARPVVGYRADFAESEYVHSEERDVVLLRQVPPHGVGALLGELVIVTVGACRIRESLYLQYKVAPVFYLGGYLIERLLSFRSELMAIEFEIDCRRILKRILIDIGSQVSERLLGVSRARVGFIGASERAIRLRLRAIGAATHIVDVFAQLRYVLAVAPRSLFEFSRSLLKRRSALVYAIARVLLGGACGRSYYHKGTQS
jgi:hypothetical protein